MKLPETPKLRTTEEPDEIPEFLTTDELAGKLRTSSETVRYWRFAGKGPASHKVGRRVLYAVDDVAAWLKETRDHAAAAS